MLSRLPAAVRGVITSTILGLNTTLVALSLLPPALAKLLLPLTAVRRGCDRLMNAQASLWVGINNAWIAAVNDVRLALGTMLTIGPDGPDRLPDDHPLAGHLDVYQWLTVLQEYLVLGLMGRPIR